MTQFAAQIIVGTFEWVIGLFLMVKLPGCPARRVVASGALVAQRLLMNVVFLVAIDARLFFLRKIGRVVTRLTHQHLMATGQRKISKIMVEGDLLMPLGLLMAILTGVP